jgi:hypothetical protein
MHPDSMLSRKVLNKRLEILFGSMDIDATNTSLAKAIPVAFPVTSNVFKVRERQVVEHGLIERYVMEAVQRFGPMGTADIETLLGLEEELVRRILQQAIDLGQSIAVRKSQYSMKETADFSSFHAEATHALKFVLNGVTGELLPKDYERVADEERLYPHEDKCEVYDMNNQKTILRAFLKHSIHDESECLLEVAEQASAEEKRELGVPQELIEVIEQDYAKRESLWIPAFLLLDTGGSAEIRGMQGNTILWDYHDATPDWLTKACTRRVSLVPEINVEAFQKDVSDAFPGITVIGTDKKNRVHLSGDENAWKTDRFLKRDKKTEWLIIAFEKGYQWDAGRGDVISLAPASPHAAKTLCLFRGIKELYRLRSTTAGEDRPARRDWWHEHVRDFGSELPKDMPPFDVSVSEFGNFVDQHPDTILQEWYEEWE